MFIGSFFRQTGKNNNSFLAASGFFPGRLGRDSRKKIIVFPALCVLCISALNLFESEDEDEPSSFHFAAPRDEGRQGAHPFPLNRRRGAGKLAGQ